MFLPLHPNLVYLRGLCGQFVDGKAAEKGRQQFFYLFCRGVGQGLGIVSARLIRILVNTPHYGKIGLCRMDQCYRMKAKLLELYSTLTSSLVSALEARLKDRVDGLQKRLAERADKEAKDIELILTELKKSIEAELKDPAYI